MERFTLELSDGATLSGLINTPSRNHATSRHVPIVVCLHGGTYNSSYFDVEGHSVRITSDALGVPVLAIDRAGYGGSSSFSNASSIPDSSSYQEEEGKWLHEQALPAIWSTYAKPLQASCLVLLTHSMGTPPAVVTAALASKAVANGNKQSYRLGGVALSGWGFTPPPPGAGVQIPDPKPARFAFPSDQKSVLMLGRKDEKLCDEAVYNLNDTIGVDLAFDEVDHGRTRWFGMAPSYTEEVTVPVLYAIGQNDALWLHGDQDVSDHHKAFANSPKVEGGIMQRAPHCIELSFQGKTWYAKVFAFAMECAEAVGQTS